MSSMTEPFGHHSRWVMDRDFKGLDENLERGHPRLEDGMDGDFGGSGIRVKRREATQFEAEARTRPAPPAWSPNPTSSTPVPPAPKPRNPRRLILAIVVLTAALLGGWYGYHWWTVGRFVVWTDDAYVGAKPATLAAKVPGYIATLDVEDNASVKVGDVIATLDDGDYKLA